MLPKKEMNRRKFMFITAALGAGAALAACASPEDIEEFEEDFEEMPPLEEEEEELPGE